MGSGADNSLTITLKTLKDDDDGNECKSGLKGFKALLHHPMAVPYVHRQHFRIALGKYLMVRVTPDLIMTSETVKKINTKNRKCYMDKERRLKFFKAYTKTNCLLECITNYTMKLCKCTGFYLPRTKLLRYSKFLNVRYSRREKYPTMWRSELHLPG